MQQQFPFQHCLCSGINVNFENRAQQVHKCNQSCILWNGKCQILIQHFTVSSSFFLPCISSMSSVFKCKSGLCLTFDQCLAVLTNPWFRLLFISRELSFSITFLIIIKIPNASFLFTACTFKFGVLSIAFVSHRDFWNQVFAIFLTVMKIRQFFQLYLP